MWYFFLKPIKVLFESLRQSEVRLNSSIQLLVRCLDFWVRTEITSSPWLFFSFFLYSHESAGLTLLSLGWDWAWVLPSTLGTPRHTPRRYQQSPLSGASRPSPCLFHPYRCKLCRSGKEMWLHPGEGTVRKVYKTLFLLVEAQIKD